MENFLTFLSTVFLLAVINTNNLATALPYVDDTTTTSSGDVQNVSNGSETMNEDVVSNREIGGLVKRSAASKLYDHDVHLCYTRSNGTSYTSWAHPKSTDKFNGGWKQEFCQNPGQSCLHDIDSKLPDFVIGTCEHRFIYLHFTDSYGVTSVDNKSRIAVGCECNVKMSTAPQKKRNENLN